MKVNIHIVEILGELADVFDRLDEESVEQFVGHLLRAKQVFLVASGRSRRMAQALTTRLIQLGLKAAMAGESTTSRAGRGDAVIAISRSGRTPSVNAIAQRTRSEGAMILAITASRRTPLTRLASHVVYLSADGGRQYGGSLFEQAVLLLGDAIAMDLQERAGLTDHAMDRTHTNLE